MESSDAAELNTRAKQTPVSRGGRVENPKTLCVAYGTMLPFKSGLVMTSHWTKAKFRFFTELPRVQTEPKTPPFRTKTEFADAASFELSRRCLR